MMPDEPRPSPGSKKTRSRAAAEQGAVRKEIIEATVQAEQAAKDLRVKLVAMIDAAALMRANRRRATAIDRVDFEAAFDDVVNPFPRPKRLAFIGDLCGIFGAGFVGYSINIYTSSGSPHQVGHIAILAGVILSVAGACLKYIDPSR